MVTRIDISLEKMGFLMKRKANKKVFYGRMRVTNHLKLLRAMTLYKTQKIRIILYLKIR